MAEHGDEAALLSLNSLGHRAQDTPLTPGLRYRVVGQPAPAGVAPHVITGGEGGVPRRHQLGGGG